MNSSFWKFFSSKSSDLGSNTTIQDDLSPAAEEAIYSAMVAGSFPKTRVKSVNSSYWLAREALDDERLAMIEGEDDTQMYYLAVPTRVFANGSLNTLRLAAALPNHPDHEGDGAYLLRLREDAAVAVLKSGNEIKIVCNEYQAVMDSIDDSGLPVVDCEEKSGAPLISLRLASEQTADIATKWIGRISALVLGVSVVTFVGSTIATTVIQGRSKELIATREKGFAETVNQVALSSPLAERMAKFQHISSVVVRAGGWIKAYLFKDGKESFVVELPEWVSRDYLDALGPDITTEIDKVNSILVVSKGMKLEKK